MRKLILWELCKKFKFDQANNQANNPEFVLEYETHKLLWDFEIPADPLISARRLDLVIANKKKRTLNSGLWRHCESQSNKKKESKKRDKYLEPGRNTKQNNKTKQSPLPKNKTKQSKKQKKQKQNKTKKLGSVKVTEGKYLEIPSHLKKLWIMKMTVIVGAYGTVSMNLEKWLDELDIRRKIEAI